MEEPQCRRRRQHGVAPVGLPGRWCRAGRGPPFHRMTPSPPGAEVPPHLGSVPTQGEDGAGANPPRVCFEGLQPPQPPVCPTGGELWQQGEGVGAPRRAPVCVRLRGHLPGDTHPGTVRESEQGTLTCQATTMACIDSQIPTRLKVGCLFSAPIPRFVAFLGWAFPLSFPRCSCCRGHPGAPIAERLSSTARSHSTSVLARAEGSSWGPPLTHPGLQPLLLGVKTQCQAPGVPTLTVRWVAPPRLILEELSSSSPGAISQGCAGDESVSLLHPWGRMLAPTTASSPPAHPAQAGTERAANCWGN